MTSIEPLLRFSFSFIIYNPQLTCYWPCIIFLANTVMLLYSWSERGHTPLPTSSLLILYNVTAQRSVPLLYKHWTLLSKKLDNHQNSRSYVIFCIYTYACYIVPQPVKKFMFIAFTIIMYSRSLTTRAQGRAFATSSLIKAGNGSSMSCLPASIMRRDGCVLMYQYKHILFYIYYII
jgi:hypothetical protein